MKILSLIISILIISSCSGTKSEESFKNKNIVDEGNLESSETQTEENGQNVSEEEDVTCERLSYYLDTDGDGYGTGEGVLACESPGSVFVVLSGDCDDTNKMMNPGTAEFCDNLDNNCNGFVDEDRTQLTFYKDNDGDGFGNLNITKRGCQKPEGYVEHSNDCDDILASVHPGAPEICNGINDNCNSDTDEGCACEFGRSEICGKDMGICTTGMRYCINGRWGSCDGVNPLPQETCNGFDDDCDGVMAECDYPNVADPAFQPSPSGTFYDSLDIYAISETEGAIVHCTTDGSEPTESSMLCDNQHKISLSNTTGIVQRIRARAYANIAGETKASNIITAEYTINFRWTKIGTRYSTPRCTQHTASWTSTDVIIWGCLGIVSRYGFIFTPSSLNLDYTTINNVTAGNIPPPLQNHTAVYDGENKRMYVWGGYNLLTNPKTHFDNTKMYYYDQNQNPNQWVKPEVSGTPPSKRAYHSAVCIGCNETGGEKKIIVWGGQADDGLTPKGDGRVFNTIAAEWTQISGSTAGSPSARYFQTAILTDLNEMIIWGGYDGTVYKNDGAICDFNSAENSCTWTAISNPLNFVLEGRAGHTAIWTGSKMIIWGGVGIGDVYYNNGGIFDPATNEWRQVNTNGAPSARANHTAVWDPVNKRMIVFGGKGKASMGFTEIYNNGGIYYPDADNGTGKWELIPTAFYYNVTAPTGIKELSKRSHHTAVWTGDKMFIFGGQFATEDAKYGDGGLYTPPPPPTQ